MSTDLSKYFNHASVSPMLPEVKAAIQEITEAQSKRSFTYLAKLTELNQQLKAAFATLVHCPTYNLSIQGNTATSLSTLALGLDWQPGDEVILIEEDFPSVRFPFMGLAERLKFKIKWIPKADFLENPLSAIEQVKSPKTKLLVTSWVGYTTGIALDLNKIGDYLKQENILFAVDGTQGLGVLPINLSESPIDFFAVSTYKWLCCPHGAAFFYISDALMHKVNPSILGWLSSDANHQQPQKELRINRKDAQQYENGGKAIVALAGSIAALEALNQLGFEKISKQTLSLSKQLADGLENAGVPLAYNYTEKDRSGIIITKRSPQNETLSDRLNKMGFKFTFRDGKLRFSPYYYQTKEDIDFLIQSLG